MRTRPGFRYSWNPASARPVFCTCGLVIRRPTPSAPASSSSGSPNDSGRLASSSRTETPGGGVTATDYRLPTLGDTLRFRLDQRELAVAAIQHADRIALGIVEDDQVAVAGDLPRGVGHRHRLDRLARGPEDRR